MVSEEYLERVLLPMRHHNFMDVTDHPNISPAGLKQPRVAEYPDQPLHKALVERLISLLQQNTLRDYNNALTSFFNRYYTTETGRAAAQYIHDEYARLAAENNRDDVTVQFFPHSWLQPSVIARIQGTGPDAGELVIIGGHEDSIAGGPAGRAPGADDDGSGSCTLLTIFKALMESGFTPSRTVEFHAYAAEEVGLRGSQAVAASYQREGKDVYAMMQFDMTMYAGAIPRIGIVTDFVNTALTDYLRLLVDSYSQLEWVNTRCGYACSDHASWTNAGYPSSFPFESAFGNSNPYIHSANDVINHLSMAHGLEFAKVGLAFVVELSS